MHTFARVAELARRLGVEPCPFKSIVFGYGPDQVPGETESVQGYDLLDILESIADWLEGVADTTTVTAALPQTPDPTWDDPVPAPPDPNYGRATPSAQHAANLSAEITRLTKERDEARAALAVVRTGIAEGVWFWQGDGTDRDEASDDAADSGRADAEAVATVRLSVPGMDCAGACTPRPRLQTRWHTLRTGLPTGARSNANREHCLVPSSSRSPKGTATRP